MKSNYNYQTNKVECEIGEKSLLPSATIPDQTFSIQELINRYASGQSLGGYKVPQYAENPEQDILQGKDWRTFDLSEQYQILKDAKEEYKNTVDRLRNNKKSEISKNPTENTQDLS